MKNILPIITKEGLRIDFCDERSGKLLNYIRFEHTNCEDDTPTFIGSISRGERAKLEKLKSVIDFYLIKKAKKAKTKP